LCSLHYGGIHGRLARRMQWNGFTATPQALRRRAI